jgi:DNA-binding response OmpR family regulator
MNILLIEDELFIVKLYQKVLTGAGHVVDVAVDGQQALASLASKKYDLLLVDLMIPYVDGTEVLRKIRADEAGLNHKTTAWITTNYEPREEDKVEMLSFAQNFVIKAEITPRKLSELITERLTGTLA